MRRGAGGSYARPVEPARTFQGVIDMCNRRLQSAAGAGEDHGARVVPTKGSAPTWPSGMADHCFDDFAAGSWSDYQAARERYLRRRAQTARRPPERRTT